MAVKATCHVYVLRCSLKDQTPMCKKELLMIALMSSPQCTGQAFNEDRRSTPRPLPMPTTDKKAFQVHQASAAESTGSKILDSGHLRSICLALLGTACVCSLPASSR